MNRKGSSRIQAPMKHAANKPKSVAKNQTEQLVAFLKKAKKGGIKPIDTETLDAMGEVWPEEENIDEFIAWLRKSRKEGRY